MGAFAALIFPTTLSIISNTFRERRERAAALGIWGAVVGLGVAAGPITGGVLLEHFYWGSVFWALVPLALVTAVAAYVLVPESRDPGVPPLDLPGLGLSIAMLASLTYTIIEAPAHGWSSVRDAWAGSRPRPRCWSPSWSASAGRRTRCSTSRCSATAASAPPAER